ncbi:class II aldolase/adducin family protein [Telmatospirillum sp.]|uniref:class II aldolase/adducin family protein n=1 Tax=Telmatospirillum sp. TaxID=2079197 RepID=UPI00284B0311|nr:class II aldolase/adducin family protein [Telmatospirillum sp.]MDR3438741.1 class II aldolase/adducin family protein [Telmatospirillum sp.]
MSRFTAARWSVVDACVALADRGYLAGIGGNVALRLDEQHLAVTPTSADYYTMTADDICVLSRDTLAVVEGQRAPTVEKSLHAAMLAFHTDCRACVHTHQPVASAVALLSVDLPLGDRHRTRLGELAALVPYAPSGTALLARALKKTLRPGNRAYLMRNHGVICAVPTLDDALADLGAIESAAAAFLLARLRNDDLPPGIAALAIEKLEHIAHTVS